MDSQILLNVGMFVLGVLVVRFFVNSYMLKAQARYAFVKEYTQVLNQPEFKAKRERS